MLKLWRRNQQMVPSEGAETIDENEGSRTMLP